MDSEIRENDLLDKTETNPLHELQQAIAALPDVDAQKVLTALAKLQAGTLDILGNEADCLASAERIAQKILEESGDKPL